MRDGISSSEAGRRNIAIERGRCIMRLWAIVEGNGSLSKLTGCSLDAKNQDSDLNVQNVMSARRMLLEMKHYCQHAMSLSMQRTQS